MKWHRHLALCLTTVVACGGGTDGDSTATVDEEAAGSASGVVAEALAAWEANAEGVAGYTITLEEDGRQRTESYVRDSVDGMPVFRPAESASMDDAMVQVPRLLRAARSDGSGEVDGEPTDRLVLDDPATLTAAMGGAGSEQFRPTRLEIHVGKDDRMPRRFQMVGEVTIPDGEARETTTTVTMTDWRTVDGFAYPYRTVARTEGLEDMMGTALEGLEAARAEMERQIEQLPEGQREMARQAMERNMGAVMGGDDNPLESETVVVDLQVERGP